MFDTRFIFIIGRAQLSAHLTLVVSAAKAEVKSISVDGHKYGSASGSVAT